MDGKVQSIIQSTPRAQKASETNGFPSGAKPLYLPVAIKNFTKVERTVRKCVGIKIKRPSLPQIEYDLVPKKASPGLKPDAV